MKGLLQAAGKSPSLKGDITGDETSVATAPPQRTPPAIANATNLLENAYTTLSLNNTNHTLSLTLYKTDYLFVKKFSQGFILPKLALCNSIIAYLIA
jgi:hypothetical protein